jgi:beta-fructofuranosidase
MVLWLHYRPLSGWMNDPNGLVHRQGRHHMFYQYNPQGTAFANQHWGHATSTDLLTWTEHDPALGPGPDSYDAVACFSGCAVAHPAGVSFLYTGVGVRGGEVPCLAHATDDTIATLRKDPKNPVVPGPPADDVTDFRDHTVWRAGGRWWQLIAGARAAQGGTLFAYSSNDLQAWTYEGVFADVAVSGVPGDVWECPDLIGDGDHRALVVSVIYHDRPQGRPEVWCITGAVDGGAFAVDTAAPGDIGNRFYAPQSYPVPDGRRIQFGWIRTHLDPAAQDAEALGAMSLPRELSIRDGRLHCAPAAELTGLRGAVRRTALAGPETTIALDTPRVAGELVVDDAAASGLDRVVLRDDAGTEMAVDVSALAIGSGELRLFWDAGIVEVFRGGVVGTWTDMRLAEVAAVQLVGGSGTAEVWALRRAGRVG